MDRIAVAGLSLHQASVEELERVKRALSACEEMPRRDAEAFFSGSRDRSGARSSRASLVCSLQEPGASAAKGCADLLGASEAVLLSTCNRCELFYARESGHSPSREDLELVERAFGLVEGDALRERVFLHTGRAAARHLFRVAASLDSLVLGEGEILAQVRAALAEARALGLTGRILGPLFEQAIQLGKRVRTRTDLARHPVSVVSLGVAYLAERLRGVEAPRIAVIGAGATGSHAARALAAAGLAPAFVANRTRARAETLAGELGARALELAALRAAEERLDALVSATSAPDPVLDAAALRRLAGRLPRGRRLVAVDLALPRDLEPCADARIESIDLESLRARAEENRRLRAAAATEAEELIEDQLGAAARERTADEATGSYARVVADARETFEVELARLGQGRLAHLDSRDRLLIQRWARSTFARLAHVPFQALKRLARTDALPAGDWEGIE